VQEQEGKKTMTAGLESHGGAVRRTTEEAKRVLRAGLGVEVSDTGYGLRAVGIDRTNRERLLPGIEKPSK
jgi:hypothetical protein